MSIKIETVEWNEETANYAVENIMMLMNPNYKMQENWEEIKFLIPEMNYVFYGTKSDILEERYEDIIYLDTPLPSKSLIVTPDMFCITIKHNLKEKIGFDAFLKCLKEQEISDVVNYFNDIEIGQHLKIGSAISAAVSDHNEDPELEKFQTIEAFMLNFGYDEEHFRKLLSEREFNRNYTGTTPDRGISGIEIHYPNFNRNLFLKRLEEELTERII